MDETPHKSEVVRLMQQITAEYEAAQRGLTGPARATSHTFITARMKRIQEHHEELKQIVGEQEAMKLVVDCMEESC